MSASADVSLSKGGQPKSKRSFISRLPSFRKKKSTPAKESELDMHLRSAEEDLNGGVKIRPLSQVKKSKDDNVKRRSKTSSIVASYEKRLSDLKDEESRTNGKKNGSGKTSPVDNGGKQPQQVGATTTTQKSSRFGFGFAWQKITSFENGTTNSNGKKTESKNQRDEMNANIQQARGPGCNIKSLSLDLQLPHGSPPDRESTSSVKTPESDRSSCSSNSSFKVYGQPMPYKSVFSDEPRGLKRQASSSQSEGFNSSGISLSSSISPLHDKLRTTGTTSTNIDNSENIPRLTQMNRTFNKEDSGGGVNPPIIHDRTYPIEESPTCIVNTTFKLEPEDYSAGNTGTTVEQELPQESPGVVRKENSISCAEEPPISTAVEQNGDAPCESGSQSRALDKVTLLSQVVCRPSASPAREIPKGIKPVNACIKNSRTDPLVSPRHRPTSNTMGAVQSSADAFSTPARPVELPLHLRNPHISAIKHCSESLDSCELDSLCSEDLMCDSRYLDDDTFDTRDESCLLSRSLSVEETAAMQRAQLGWTGRARAVSVDQLPSNCSLEKRVGVTRGLAPSPLGLPLGRRGGRNYPAHPVLDEACQSPVEELQSLITSSSYRDSDRNKNGNANSNATRVRSQSGGNGHPLRPPRWPSFPPEEEGTVLVDAVVYRHMIQDMTSVKTMLFKLKRALQAVDSTSSPFEQAFSSPCVSPLTSPMSEDNPIQEAILDDLKEENHVLRKEVKNLQELLADTQLQLKELQLQKLVQTSAEQHDASTQCEVLTQDQSLQVFIKPHSVPVSSSAQATPTSSPTHRKYRAEVSSKIKAAYEEYIRLHTAKRCDSPEKLSNMTSRHSSPLKVGLSPTSPDPPTDLANHIQYMETSPPGSRRRPRSVEAPSSSQSSPSRRRPQSAEGPSSGRSSPESGKTSKRSPNTKSKIPLSPTRGDKMIIDQAASQNPGRYDEPSEISQNIQASVNGKGKLASAGSRGKKLTGSKKSQSKLTRPSSYKSKGSGSQDSLQSDGSQTDDGKQPTEDRKGGPLKRQLVYSQQPKSVGSALKPPTGRQEIQQKNMNSGSDGIPKPKEIRMMAVRQQSGKSVLQKGTQDQDQKDSCPQDDQRENGTLSIKLPSLLRMPKMPQTKQQEIPTNHRGLTNRPTQLIDANSNPVPHQNGVSYKTTTRTAEQSESQLKSTPVPIPCGIKQLPDSANSRLSQSPERGSSGEDEKPSPPSSPRSRAQQSSKIALPVRGRGSSRLPRGTGIPTRRTNNS